MTNLNMPGNTNVVYYIGVKGDDHVKIGTTKNLMSRLKSLSTARADGDRLVVLATEPGTYGLEQQRHAQFAGSRVHGEWFKLTPDLQEHIDRLALVVNPAYALGYDEGFQTALSDRGMFALITCEACGDERAYPSGHVDDEEHENICSSCSTQTQMGIEMTEVCDRIFRAFGPDAAIKIASVLPGTLYREFMKRLRDRTTHESPNDYERGWRSAK